MSAPRREPISHTVIMPGGGRGTNQPAEIEHHKLDPDRTHFQEGNIPAGSMDTSAFSRFAGTQHGTLVGSPNPSSDHQATSVPCSLASLNLWAWREPVSPHLAAAREGGNVGDETIIEELRRLLTPPLEADRKATDHHLDKKGEGTSKEERIRAEDGRSPRRRRWSLVETAGGVASPGPSGTLQCDLYR